MAPQTVDPLVRFSAHYEVVASGCWLWTASLFQGSGYGRFDHGRAHRFSYEVYVGPIPEGMTLDHLCHDPATCEGGPTCEHRRCVNPFHLDVKTARANILRGGTLAAANAAKTHCVHGHIFDEANTYPIPDGSGRACRTCRREAHAAWKARTTLAP